MEIVVEYVLLENLLINLIVLKTTSLILKERGRLFLLSAFFGACLTVAIPAMRLSSLGWFLVEIGQIMVLVCISFKFKSFKKFVGIFLTYFLSTLIYGGACFFFDQLFGFRSLIVVLAVLVAMFFVVTVLLKHFHKRRAVENFCFNVELESEGRKTKWKAFLDSGNLLLDPLTDNPVTLINFKVFSTLFSDIDLEDVLKKSDKLKKLKFAHYISFNTLGSGDKILVFQVDSLILGEKIVDKPTLGLCFKNFKQSFGSDIILNNNMAEKCT